MGSKSPPPFQIAAKWLEINENANWANFRTHWLAVKWCREQSYSFRQIPKWVNANRAQYVRSSSRLIAILAMTLFLLSESSNFLFLFNISVGFGRFGVGVANPPSLYPIANCQVLHRQKSVEEYKVMSTSEIFWHTVIIIVECIGKKQDKSLVSFILQPHKTIFKKNAKTKYLTKLA